MKKVNYSDIVTDELLVNSLDHDAYTGFLKDYRVLTCLLRIYKPKTIFEVGTNVGSGVNVMATALPDAKIYSLDLDYGTMRQDSKQYPIGESGEDRVGSETRFPYTQLRGDSMTFDYSKYPCEAYFVDGEHLEKNVYHETNKILLLTPKIIIYHDTDVPEVMDGIIKGIDDSKYCNWYELIKVTDTRISYLLR